MNFNDFIQKKEVQIGNKTYCISKIPAISATQIYPKIAKYYSDHGVIGLTMFDIALTKELLSYSAAYNNGAWEVLDLDSTINASFESQFDMKKLVSVIVKENWGFLTDGNLLELLGIEEAEAGSDS